MTHFLKTWPPSFELIRVGRKTHEIRSCDDRKFTEGDDVVLMEWDPARYEAMMEALKTDPDQVKVEKEATRLAFTGNNMLRKVGAVSVAGSWGLPLNICVFSVRSVT
jgi:ASC-1-like (ASCH) protein